ncbi:hypothetical protein FNW52_04860 [Flavobacterium sp. ZT3R18]|uniref:hypothetical protein n=1 Tax=Flavobacterium sp. ZT3R18 TaxID=2594429 RepID=UPI00117B5DE2|nr:hypothetical protein [Flavobacterium sp. ZT3R18]TRX37296.1 hypothetical protein FNW52_04860 [Flavobacterium sp. ZT3R18]
MKKLIIIGCLLSLMGCKTKNVNGKLMGKSVLQTEMSTAEEAQKNKAYELGKRILTTCNNAKFKPFTQSEATDKVIAKSTPENIKQICVKYNLKYGLFKDLQFVEMIPNKTDKTNVFRFKALFEYAKANKELRVTMNSENKASAITTKDWKDIFE